MSDNTRTKMKIIYQEETEKKAYAALWDMLLLLLLQTGLLLFLSVFTERQAGELAVLFLAAMAADLIFVLRFYLTQKDSSLFFFLLALIGCLAAGIRHLYLGFFGLINYMLSWWNIKYEDAIALAMQQQITDWDIDLFCLAVLIPATILFWQQLHKKSLIISGLLPLICMAAGLVVDRFSAVGCAAFLIGFVGIWLSQIRTKASNRRFGWLLSVGITVLAVSFIVGDQPVTSVMQAKERTMQAAEDLVYGKDTLPEGDLEMADQLLSGKKEVLRVKTAQKKTLYLKGFVGSRYQGGKFTQLPKSAYKGEQSGMLKWLADMSFIPQNQYASYVGLESDSQIRKNEVRVHNTGADRHYVYMPYSAAALPLIGVKENRDTNYVSDMLTGSRQYQYAEWSDTRPGELLYAKNWLQSPHTEKQELYAEAENVYARFVYDNYLELSPQMERLLDDIFYQDDFLSQDETVYDITQRIREVLTQRASYREKPEIPQGTDPVTWFLNKGHQGNAVLFASAAVLAYRAAGIPARYVEGYLVSQQMAEEAGDAEIVVTEQNAHAWVEVYLDGVGFVPIDVTPGFYYDTYTLLQMVQKPQNVSQTAGNEKDDSYGDQIDNMSDQGTASDEQRGTKKPTEIVVAHILLVPLLLLLIVTLGELYYLWCVCRIERNYKKLSPEAKTLFLIRTIDRILQIYEIDTRPGYRTEEADHILHEKWKLPEGSYCKVTEVIEKAVYGEEQLAPYERRMLTLFSEQLYEARREMGLWGRLRMHYLPCHIR